MYDSRVGRFLKMDPKMLKIPNNSTYSFAANNPVDFIDKNGKNPVHPWFGKEVEISLWYSGLVTYDPTKNKKDQKLLDATSPTIFGLPNPRSVNNNEGSWTEGANEFPADKVLPLTTDQSKTILSKLHSIDVNEFNSACNPCDHAWKEAAKSGTYTFIDDNLAESDFFHVNKSRYHLISVENNIISKISLLTRDPSSDNNKYNIESTISYKISKVQKEMTKEYKLGWAGSISYTYVYDKVTVTASITMYKNGKPQGKTKIETTTRNENYKLKE
jgi:hypothetical protein